MTTQPHNVVEMPSDFEFSPDWTTYRVSDDSGTKTLEIRARKDWHARACADFFWAFEQAGGKKFAPGWYHVDLRSVSDLSEGVCVLLRPISHLATAADALEVTGLPL